MKKADRKKERFRNEWKYLISTSEKEVLNLRMKPLMKLDPHAETGGYLIRSLYFDDYWNSAMEERMQVYLCVKSTGSGSIIAVTKALNLRERKNSAVTYTKKLRR